MDPIEEIDGMNIYTFVTNSPLSLFDQLGLLGVDANGNPVYNGSFIDNAIDWLVGNQTINNIVTSDGFENMKNALGGFGNDWLMGVPEMLGAMDSVNQDSLSYRSGAGASTVIGLFSLGRGSLGLVRRINALRGVRGSLSLGVKRLFYDKRTWSAISDQTRKGLGLKGRDSIQLGHMFFRRNNVSRTWRNAAWNIAPIWTNINQKFNKISQKYGKIGAIAGRTLEAGYGAEYAANIARAIASPFKAFSQLFQKDEKCN